MILSFFYQNMQLIGDIDLVTDVFEILLSKPIKLYDPQI